MQSIHSPFRRKLLSSLLMLACIGPATALAASYPDRVVKIVVPFSAGGGTDIIARIVADKLSDKFGKQFIVQNSPGAGGTIGAASVARAEPDGYTLLVWHIGMISADYMYKQLPYNSQKDFTPISLLSSASNLIAVNPGVPANTLGELVALAKRKPGELNYGSSGIGGADHLAGELLQRVANIKTTHVPYKGGGPATVAAVGGEVQFVTGTASQVMTMVKAGRLKALAVTQKQRSPSMPDVPSAAEAGYPELDYTTWFGLWGPAKMPADVVIEINKAVREILARDDVRAALAKAGVEPRSSTPQEFDAMYKSQYIKWSKTLSEVLTKTE
ncbi:MAG: transporter [Herminiimonas sp.]|jgi:tripartite-type tricarboxylate transporter receptor subunit TctC|nr:transporter [Herminiimonas sp.]MDB5949087.1 transporter [Massilia sp.]